jgi:DNA-binding LytR/AlgR family response regulator
MHNKQIRREAKYFRLSPFKRELSCTDHRIAISLNGQIAVIDITDILYLKADSNYTHIYLADGSSMLTSVTLKRFEEKLNAQHFTRIHSGFLVQNNCIRSFNQKRSKILLSNKTEIPVARSRKEALMALFKPLMI